MCKFEAIRTYILKQVLSLFSSCYPNFTVKIIFVMIFIQAFLPFALILFLLHSSLATDDAGNKPLNPKNPPQRSRTAMHRAPPTTIRHRGNRVVTAGQPNARNTITKHALSKKIIKKAHKTVQLRTQRLSANRGLGKVAQDPEVN